MPDTTEQSSCTARRWPFHKRMWLHFLASVLLALFLHVPQFVHYWFVHSYMEHLRAVITWEASATPGQQNAAGVLNDAGFRIIHAATQPVPGTDAPLGFRFAKYTYSNGTLFWPPATIWVDLEDAPEGSTRASGWRVIRMPGPNAATSAWTAIVPGTAAFLPLAVVLYIIYRVNQRAMRERRRECQECGYPIGVSPVCTECGSALMSQGAPASPRD